MASAALAIGRNRGADAIVASVIAVGVIPGCGRRPLHFRWAFFAALSVLSVASGCSSVPLSPEQAACLTRMERHVEALRPAFANLGFTPAVYLRLDEDMLDARGFRKATTVLGDAVASGNIRLRPSRVCPDEAVARGVVAHEMSHVALRHIGVISTGVTLMWERQPQQEIEADELALRVLKATASDPRASQFLYCRLGACGELPPPQGTPKGRVRGTLPAG